jgi:ABC-2 type transport system ATP-binding protein
MKEDVLEVMCDRPQGAMGEIEGLPDVREAALFGKGLHVVTTNAQSASAAIRETLGRRGYAVTRVGKIMPSLEDVFVSLIEAHDRAEKPIVEVRR